MTDFLTLAVLIVLIGSFIFKSGELLIAIFKLIAYFALPLTIAGVIFLGPKLIHWILN